MKLSTFRRSLLGQHKAQQALFASIVRSMLKEHAKVPEAKEFLAVVASVRDLLAEQTAGANGIWAAADLLPPGEGNRTPELLFPIATETRGPNLYEYLTAKRKMIELLGDVDERNKALAAYSTIMDRAKPLKDSDPKEYAYAVEIGWRLCGTQNQIHALVRQVEAITATQEAIMRSYGLRFWQGRMRHLRWEGDKKGA